MGRMSKGILGPFRGTIGAVIGSSWRGINYMRSQPSPRGNAGSSMAQLAQQHRFAVMGKFIKAFSGLFSISFSNNASKMTGANNAFSYNVRNAITGVYPDYAVDYPLALVSRGELLNGNAPAAAKAGTDIVFTWGNNAGLGRALASDKTIAVVYCKEFNQGFYNIGASVRGDGTETIDCAAFAGKQVQTWIGFISEDGKDIANSVFTGAITV